MADGLLIFLWPALLSITAHSGLEVEALRVETVTVNPLHSPCESWVRVGAEDTYRITMPRLQECPSAGFTCAIHFERTFPIDGLPYHISPRPADQICVDFSRIRLAGAKTKFIISTNVYLETTLTSSRYPLIRKYMKTVKCFGRYVKNLTLTFTSDCDTPGRSLQDHFSSWIYVYAQLSAKHLVYYLDGTCRHTETQYTYSEKLSFIIRSIYWNDTAYGPEIQSCSLLMNTYNVDDSTKFCTKWNFKQTSCEVSVHLRRADIEDKFDYRSSRNYSCHMGRSTYMDACVPFTALDKPVIDVIRNQSIADDRMLEDGVLLFEVEAFQKTEKKKKTNYEMHKSDSIAGIIALLIGTGLRLCLTYERRKAQQCQLKIYETENVDSDIDDIDENLGYKILFPLALLLSVCCCICGVSRKRAKARHEQSGLMTADPNGDVTSPDRQAADTVTPALRPRDGPGQGPGPTVWGQDSEVGGMAAPPPAYGDLNFTLPPLTPAQDERLARGERWDGVHVLAGDSIEPPPLISEGSSRAPPAYHELFPSNA